jgi:hypothetical protein
MRRRHGADVKAPLEPLCRKTGAGAEEVICLANAMNESHSHSRGNRSNTRAFIIQTLAGARFVDRNSCRKTDFSVRHYLAGTNSTLSDLSS